MLYLAKKRSSVLLSAALTGLIIIGFVLYALSSLDAYDYRAAIRSCWAESGSLKLVYSEFLIQNKEPPSSLSEMGFSSTPEFEFIDEINIRQSGLDLRCDENTDYVSLRLSYRLSSDRMVQWDCTVVAPDELSPGGCD